MLTEMDGIESRKGVFLMAASNRPEIVDPAVLRPGRLDKNLYVGIPSASDRVGILNALTKVFLKIRILWDVMVYYQLSNSKCFKGSAVLCNDENYLPIGTASHLRLKPSTECMHVFWGMYGNRLDVTILAGSGHGLIG
jgi:SpoVK/Ycf46/Vps4 family AAA+-type ATPase